MLRGPDARLRLVATLLIAMLLPVVVQLVRLQIMEHPRYQTEVEDLVRRQYALPEPPWGSIRDRNGDLLVGNVPVYDVGAEVNLVRDPLEAARQLASLLNRPESELVADLTAPAESEGLVWRMLAKHIPAESAEQIEALNWPWLTLTPTWERYYAEGALAAHTLGFVNQDGRGYGVQAYQRRFLQGETVARIGVVGGNNSPLPGDMAEEGGLPYPGTDLRLTIDRTIQAYVEGELDNALREYKAESGTIIVMNPRTGELLAIANRPTYEPYRYADYAVDNAKIFQDPAVSIPYEPGSVFKIITVAAAVDSGRATLDWSYQDRGGLEYGGIIVRNWSGGAYGQQNLQGLLSHSLNVGAATLSTQVLGPELFYKYVKAFGFGQPTGVEVSNEAAGLVHTSTDWDWADSYLATNAFGQGIAVTPLQMATAAAALANDGVMMQPHIVAERRYPDGSVVPIPPRPLGQPVSAETARVVSGLLANAVAKEVPEALVEGYRIAGKTGTAQIPGVGGYEPEDVIVSFVGYGPLPDPQVLILVKLDRPDVPYTMRWGSMTAAPVFQKIATRLFVLLGIPPADVAMSNR
jgi:cell division protein FtsI/penicillin-binding protein 2